MCRQIISHPHFLQTFLPPAAMFHVDRWGAQSSCWWNIWHHAGGQIHKPWEKAALLPYKAASHPLPCSSPAPRPGWGGIYRERSAGLVFLIRSSACRRDSGPSRLRWGKMDEWRQLRCSEHRWGCRVFVPAADSRTHLLRPCSCGRWLFHLGEPGDWWTHQTGHTGKAISAQLSFKYWWWNQKTEEMKIRWLIMQKTIKDADCPQKPDSNYKHCIY